MITPAGHRVLILPDPVEEKTASGIIMVTQAQGKTELAHQTYGTVVAVGATAFKDFGGAPWCKVGDHVSFAKWGGYTMVAPGDDTEYRLLNDEDITAVITEEKNNGD